MKKHAKKLVLSRETVQLLDAPHWMKEVQGGGTFGPACVTATCDTACGGGACG